MFDTVLVANRGEIAVRIIRTLRAMGIRSVAVYSDADANARHVTDADVARRIGPAPAALSYLSVERIIEAALATGAQALHPGYGFLAENSALATACTEAGIVFVGPTAAVIDAMGDKIRAKATVEARGVKVVPGVSGAGLDDEELAAQARSIGFPVLIKPSAGGGGKGMRVVATADELPAEIASAKREALGAFGDSTLLIERLIERPRHIEVQVLADAHDNIVHLGERECTLQRRHQKVIEEAPSAFLSEEQRDAIAAQAVAAAQACGYVNAGTVEFIVSGNRPDEAYFMEMNTRLQVEHPVTEMVWGLDLVELQLRVAAGESLPFTQADLKRRGHSIEARVYAEDVRRGFLPTGGRVVALHEPIEMSNVRVDSSLFVGSEIGSNYDPMLSKVIAWGPDRASARRTLDRALASTSVLGVTTNVAFLRVVLADPSVADATMDTSLVERIAEQAPPRSTPPHIAAVAALCQLSTGQLHPPAAPPWDDLGGWRIGEPAWVTWRAVSGDGEDLTVQLRRTNAASQFEVMAADGSVVATTLRMHDGEGHVEFGGATTPFRVATSGATTWIGSDGDAWSFTAHEPTVAGHTQIDHGAAIVSPMPGTVIAVLVSPGESVTVGQPVVVVEAMKMEHTLRASTAGTVSDLLVQVGERVALNQLLAVIDPAQTSEEDDGLRPIS
ncbi:MAG: acetyl-CoA/propionyl-CoA carboxylase, biotin carboxylase, biotin carboxyl carrier protein [Ilumatobacteraceae bacterium]|nr:acetyl-CoA/propionyl-CoA carboxylase, biotin carboxylase, biotin carboxyl carrier protein [Ilumatobacteraceae bacterium]